MKAVDIITEDLSKLFEILNTVLPYRLTVTQNFKDIIYKEYAIDSKEPLIVNVQSLRLYNERIGEVSFYHPTHGFKQLNTFEVGEVAGVLATVVDICKNLTDVDTWYFSAKQHPYTTSGELIKRSSLYLRVSKRLSSELNMHFRTFTAMGGQFYVISNSPITDDKIKKYVNHVR